jgi:Ca2+-binding RTX toxin-like protein
MNEARRLPRRKAPLVAILALEAFLIVAAIAFGHTLGFDDCGIPYGSSYCPENNDWDGHEHTDEMWGRGGNDFMRSHDGDDKIHGGGETDIGSAGGHADVSEGENGGDGQWIDGTPVTLQGGEGQDTIRGDQGSDLVGGGPNIDWIVGGEGSDDVFGRKNSDGVGEHDNLYGEQGDDDLYADDGAADHVHGGTDYDTCDVDRNKDTWWSCYPY